MHHNTTSRLFIFVCVVWSERGAGSYAMTSLDEMVGNNLCVNDIMQERKHMNMERGVHR